MDVKEKNEMVKNLVMGTTAKLLYYRNNNLYYHIKANDGKNYLFPVYIGSDGDVGNATLNAKEKASVLMSYIRKAIKEGTLTEEK